MAGDNHPSSTLERDVSKGAWLEGHLCSGKDALIPTHLKSTPAQNTEGADNFIMRSRYYTVNYFKLNIVS